MTDSRMTVKLQITREGEEEDLDLTVNAEHATLQEAFAMVVSAAEMMVSADIEQVLVRNGATPEEAAYATPLRVRLLVIETLLGQPFRAGTTVHLDL